MRAARSSHQHRDLDGGHGRARQRRDRLRHPDQHRHDGRPPADQRRQGDPSVHRRERPCDPPDVDLYDFPVSRGLLVEQVDRGSPAAKAGVRGGAAGVIVSGESYVVGEDIITGFDGVPMTSETRFRDLIAAKDPGDGVISRSGEAKKSCASSSRSGGFPRRLPFPRLAA